MLWYRDRWSLPTRSVRVALVKHDAVGNLERMRLAANDLMERPKPVVDSPMTQAAVEDGRFASLYPSAWEYLTKDVYSDGSVRARSSMLIFAQDGGFKLMLKDPDGERCLWVACPTVTGLFGVLEGALTKQTIDWRIDRKKPGQKAGRASKVA